MECSLIKHIRRWNIWRKKNINGPVHKVLVLLGFRKSPTMTLTLLPEEIPGWLQKKGENV